MCKEVNLMANDGHICCAFVKVYTVGSRSKINADWSVWVVMLVETWPFL